MTDCPIAFFECETCENIEGLPPEFVDAMVEQEIKITVHCPECDGPIAVVKGEQPARLGGNDKRRFRNRLCIIRSIDRHEVPALSERQWERLRKDPYLGYLRLDEMGEAIVFNAILKRGG